MKEGECEECDGQGRGRGWWWWGGCCGVGPADAHRRGAGGRLLPKEARELSAGAFAKLPLRSSCSRVCMPPAADPTAAKPLADICARVRWGARKRFPAHAQAAERGGDRSTRFTAGFVRAEARTFKAGGAGARGRTAQRGH